MRRTVLLCLCLLVGLLVVGCGPTLTEQEKNAPPPAGPRGEYQPPPPGANPGSRGPGGAPMGSSMPAGANPGMAPR